MRSKYLKNRFNTSKEELKRLGNEFTNEALPLLDKLYNLTFWILPDKKSTNKIIKQVFFEAIEDCDITKNDADWQSWIQRIWMREILDFYSEKENDRNTDFGFIDNFKVDLDKVQTIFNSDEASIIDSELLQKLPPVLRIPLMMREFAQFDYEKISDLIDVPVGVAATRIYRARKLLCLYILNEFNYEEEKNHWLDSKSSRSIFELRKCSLLIDNEFTEDEKIIFTEVMKENNFLRNELSIQSEVKKKLIRLTHQNIDINSIKSKIVKKASKRFNIN